MKICKCGELIPKQRLALKYDTCLRCGAAQAAQRSEQMRNGVTPMSHKSGFTYVTEEARKEHVKGLNKTEPLPAYLTFSGVQRKQEKKCRVIRVRAKYPKRINGELVWPVTVVRIPIEE